MSILKYSLLLSSLIFLTSCSNVSVYDFKKRTPALIPNQFFIGKLCADGVVRDARGGGLLRDASPRRSVAIRHRRQHRREGDGRQHRQRLLHAGLDRGAGESGRTYFDSGFRAFIRE